jgi:hypothetical protein
LSLTGISGKLFEWFKDYLSNRQQRVVLFGSTSDLLNINAGVPQGSILGPLLLIVYINNIVLGIQSIIRLFADDTSLYMLYLIVENPITTAEIMNSDLNKISNWADTWLVKLNLSKKESILITKKHRSHNNPPLFMNNIQISEVESHKHLGVTLSSNESCYEHISKAWQRINIMRKLKLTLDRKSLETIYFSFIRPILEYADVVWDNLTQKEEYELEQIQFEAARIITGATKLVSLSNLYSKLVFKLFKLLNLEGLNTN